MSSFTPQSEVVDLAYDKSCALYDRRKELENSYRTYLEEHSDLQNYLHDFMQAVLIHQPEDTLQFTKQYFTSMKM